MAVGGRHLGMDIDLRGDRALVRKLDALPAKIEKRVLSKAVRGAAKIYRKAARSNAPVRTGRLKKSIKTRAIRRRGRNRFSIGVRVSTGTRAELGIAPDAPGYYPAALEYGWTDRHGVRHAPKAYARPAWYSTKGRMQSDMVARIRAGVQEESKR